VLGQGDTWARFAVIEYHRNRRQFVFYAKQWSSSDVSSYICQLQPQGLFKYEYINYPV